MKKLYTSVDIGSETIKVIVLELHKNRLNLLAASSVKSSGIKKGLITNATAAIASLKSAILEVEGILGVSIKKVLASVPSHNASFIYSKATADIEGEEAKVTTNDINNVLKKMIKDKIPLEQELVTIQPIDFAVDDRMELRDPKGLTGKQLSCRGIIVATPKKNIYSVVSLIEAAGLEVVDVSINGIGDGYAFRNKENKEQIGAVINIGAETITVSLYNKGVLVKSAVIPLGGRNIDSDIAYIFKLSLQNACQLKEKFASSHRRFSSAEDLREVENLNEEEIKINQYELSEVVMFRCEELLELAKKHLNSLTNKKMQYIILTGGTSHLSNIKTLAEEVFNQKVLIGDIKLIGARNNKYSSAIGNVVYFINKLNVKGKEYSMFSQYEQEDIADAKKGDMFGSTTLSRVLGFFTNE